MEEKRKQMRTQKKGAADAQSRPFTEQEKVKRIRGKSRYLLIVDLKFFQ